MKSTVGIRIVLALGILVLFTGAFSEFKHLVPGAPDFTVYYTAAYLVRSGENLHLYDDALRAQNRFLVKADEDTVFAKTARAQGVSKIELYTYPPTLADLLAPLTLLSPHAALILWQLLNLAALLASTLLLARILEVHSLAHTGLLAIILFAFRPSLTSFNWGQVSFILLFLLTAGLSLYLCGQKYWAGLLFALAVAIKLTPLIVILPLIAWRDWKALRAIAIGGAAIVAVLLMINGSETLSLYFLHVLPAMANGAVDIDNRTFANLIAVYCFGFVQSTPPLWTVWAERLISVAVLCYAGWLSQLGIEDFMQNNKKVEIEANFLLISCCLAPVTWVHAYLLAAPALVMDGKRIWERRSNAAETTLLLLFTLSISISSTKATYFAVTTPLLGVALALMRLRALQMEPINDSCPS